MSRLVLALILSAASVALAAADEFNVTLEGHKFNPDRIEIPAGKKVKFFVENKDATPEEFESEALRIEKVIPGHGKATIYVGPLKPGEYKFVGEYNEKTAHGVVVAK